MVYQPGIQSQLLNAVQTSALPSSFPKPLIINYLSATHITTFQEKDHCEWQIRKTLPRQTICLACNRIPSNDSSTLTSHSAPWLL